MSNPPGDAGHQDGGHFPGLSIAEWLTFGLLAAVLAVTNIYTTLLTGWGDTGSIIAVIAAVLILRSIGRKEPTIASLNLGQTIASAGGSVGFAVATYAAVHVVDPEFDPSLPVLTLMFIAMSVIGTMVGASVRRYMVRYFFPSGTACAVIQTAVSQSSTKVGQRPIRLLSIWGSVASLVTIPTKITLAKGGHALVEPFTLFNHKNHAIGVGVEPLLYGIGIIVGPRIGLGMIIGGLSGPFILQPWLESAGITTPGYGDWLKWAAIGVLTIPTFATIVFAYLFRTPPVIPPGFEPGTATYTVPSNRRIVYAALGILGLTGTAVTGEILFDLPFWVTGLTVIISWPLCIMNGRVAGDTDINPVRLVAVVLLTAFAFLISGSAVTLLGMAVIGGTLAGMAVDMMQDYRTGYLVNANPNHQTTVQFYGTIVGAIVAVPFFFVIESAMGFGEGTSLPAPGAQVWAAMAQAFAGESTMTAQLIWAVVVISLLGSVYAFFTVWPKTARWMPSIFGMGIGMLLPVEMGAAIFVGGMIKLVVTQVYVSRERDKGAKALAANEARNDTMLVGASIFAASAVVSVILVLITQLFGKLDIGWFFLAGH